MDPEPGTDETAENGAAGVEAGDVKGKAAQAAPLELSS